MSEAELCLRLEEFYAEWEIYKEVPGIRSGRVDLYIKKGLLWIAIEVKKQLSVGLIYQAMETRPHANYTYIAIPDLKIIGGARQICKEFGIGILAYRIRMLGTAEWQEILHPQFRRKIVPVPVLETMKIATAGVQHNDQSEYKVSLYHMTMWISRNGGRCLIKEIFENSHYHYSSSKSAMQCITRLCRQGVIKEFTIEGKEFVITEHGKNLLIK